MYTRIQYIWSLLRIGLGWLFLWAFIDKIFGLGFATAPENAWLAGGSPTFGFLKFGTQGPFASLFQSLAGSAVVDWLFMLGLLLIGCALILGIGVRIASISGSLLLFLMWLAVLPPDHNPFLDDHIIYILILAGIGTTRAGSPLGFGNWWAGTRLVQKHPFLR